MDARDINIDVVYPGSSSFRDLFKLQKNLLDRYIGIEVLPNYPIDINTKESQVWIKDFTGRIIEELGEAHESYLEMLDMKNKGEPMEKLVPHLQNFNEEIADALHFWLELMIFSDYEEGHVAKWLGVDAGMHEDLLTKSLEMGEFFIHQEQMFKIFKSKQVIKDKNLSDNFLRGGRNLSDEIRDEFRKLLWDITYHLQLVRNTLKNKPWKQTHMMTDENQYEVHMANVFQSMFKFFYFAGFSKESLYEIYYKKNRVNEFRIKSKY